MGRNKLTKMDKHAQKWTQTNRDEQELTETDISTIAILVQKTLFTVHMKPCHVHHFFLLEKR